MGTSKWWFGLIGQCHVLDGKTRFVSTLFSYFCGLLDYIVKYCKTKEYRQGHAMAPEIGKWKKKQSIFGDDVDIMC